MWINLSIIWWSWQFCWSLRKLKIESHYLRNMCIKQICGSKKTAKIKSKHLASCLSWKNELPTSHLPPLYFIDNKYFLPRTYKSDQFLPCHSLLLAKCHWFSGWQTSFGLMDLRLNSDNNLLILFWIKTPAI